jgi:polysaccharide biosynthesis/export protein
MGKMKGKVWALLIAVSLSAQVNPYQLYQQQPQPQQPDSVDGVQIECPDGTPTIDCAPREIDGNQPHTSSRPPYPSQFPSPYSYPPTYPSNSQSTTDYKGRESLRQLPPSYQIKEQPTEFQRFVQSSTGRLLPIYGASLFDRVPSTFSPLDRTPVTPDYMVGPGDEIDVYAWGQINLNQRVTVDRTGNIFLPQVGRIRLAGIKFGQLRNTVQSAMERVYRSFDLDVNMGQLRSIQIFIVGQARRPGSYTVSSLSTLVNALFASGGPSSRGSLRNIQLKRGGRVVTNFDLYDLLLEGDKTKDVPLLPGDVIFVPNAGPRVAVTGSIESPAIYELKPDTSLGDILSYAGGLSPTASGQRAILERIDQRSALYSENIALTPEGAAIHPRDGDLIRILPVVPRFERTVTLRGNVADPVRFPWHPGIKVSDLIPNKESLLTRGYWKEHNGLIEQENHNEDRQDTRHEDWQDTRHEDQDEDREQSEPRRTPAVIKASSSDERLKENSRAYRDEQRDTQGDSSLAAATASREISVRQFLRKNDIQPLAPDIDWNYATIERLDPKNLTTYLISFNLGKVVIDHDASADIALEPNDVVTVFSNADISVPRSQQTKYVRVEGEIKMAGVYSVRPGETLHDIVARAGGLTPNAYLYGAQFTRESTRKEQQKRYNDFLDQLERDINQGAATLSGRVISAQQMTTSDTSIASQRNMLQRLRSTPVTGRIVLDLEPSTTGIDAIPKVPLENGDRLLIPSAPSTVSVVGMVYNQAAFLYGPDLRLGDYLTEAGGPTRYADRSHIFVIRADGGVVAKETRPRLFSANFEALRIYPGDTVVVPTNVNKTTFMRNLIDWSQVISNFGLGAAAVNVLK